MLSFIGKITDEITAKDKKDKGAAAGEYQILDGDIFDSNKLDKILNILPVVTVHSCLGSRGAVLLEKIFENDYYTEELLKAFRIAEYIGSRTGKEIQVIIHANEKDYILRPLQAENLGRILESNPHTGLCIENVTPISHSFQMCSNIYPEDSNEIINRLKLNPVLEKYSERFGTVLDLCHATMTIRQLYHLTRPKEDQMYFERIWIFRYFQEAKKNCRVIHISNTKNFGYGTDHGCGFKTDFELRYLEEYINLCKVMTPCAHLVFEISEADYSDAKNFSIALNHIEKIYQKGMLSYVHQISN